MTPELARRLDQGRQPFDGDCIHTVHDLSLSQLRTILQAAVAELRGVYVSVCSFEDWHEHDGFVVDGRPDDWSRIDRILETDRTLFDSRHDDFGVRIAFYSPSFDWLLRYNIDQEDESDDTTAACECDFSAAGESTAARLLDSLAAVEGELFTRCSAQQWYGSRSGG